jgi:hypothetical protein
MNVGRIIFPSSQRTSMYNTKPTTSSKKEQKTKSTGFRVNKPTKVEVGRNE